MGDLAQWLDGLGLGQYGATFAENDIDWDVLPELAEQDLEKLGLSLGHRKRLLKAISTLQSGDQASLHTQVGARVLSPNTYTPQHLAKRILQARSALQGEHKQVTVLFADIKGSLELIDGLDPEQAQALLDQVIQVMMEAVHRYEGTVNKLLGDGIMALFGAPIAHEDHAVRACYAALAMQEAVAQTAEETRGRHGIEVQIRIGLNSGGVVVRAIGNDLTMDYDAIGATTHLAGRMEQLAIPGTTRLTGNTLRLAEGFVQVRSLGPVPVKGLEAPIEIYELEGATATRSRFQTVLARGLTRFVGRQTELDALRRSLERAGGGQGQVFAIVGEPGVGKSRLCYEFTHSHHTEAWLVLESGSVSYGKATAYLPVIDLLKRYFRLEERDDDRGIREKVTGKLLTLDENLRPILEALLALLDVPVEAREWQALDPPQRRRRTLEAVRSLLLSEAQVQPLALVFEDLHWIDSESQAVLDSLVGALPTARILLLINYRPEYSHSWGSKSHYSQSRVDPLPPETAEQLLGALLGEAAALGPLKQMLIARTEGNPFFLEECVRTLVETGALVGEPGGYRGTEGDRGIQVPATVQGVLAARIDRLAVEEKQLLQTAAVIGKDVPYSLLEVVTKTSEHGLQQGLAGLQAAEFIYETRLFPDHEYTFKHALTHEVAYDSLLQEHRRGLHREIAEAIESLYASRLVEQVERLAHHYTEAGLVEQAIGYWQQAGQRAVERSAYPEAIAHLTKALDLLAGLEPEPEHARRELALQIALGVPLQAMQGSGASEVEQIYRRALALCSQIPASPQQHFAALWGLWKCHRTREELQTAREIADELLQLAKDRDDRALLLQAHHCQWTTLYHLGQFEASREHSERGTALYEQAHHHAHAFLFGGHDPCVCGLATGATNLWVLGYPDQARKQASSSLNLAHELQHPPSVSDALFSVTEVHLECGNLRGVEESAKAHLALAKHQRVGDFGWALVMEGWAQLRYGDAEDGIAKLREGLSEHQRYRRTEDDPYTFAIQAEVSAKLGQADEGLDAVAAGLTLAESTGARYWNAELYRMKGELLRAGTADQRPGAETCLQSAIAVAQSQNAKSFELRAAMSLARLWRDMGKAAEAHALLSPLYGWFTEGFGTADLKDARALLDELS